MPRNTSVLILLVIGVLLLPACGADEQPAADLVGATDASAAAADPVEVPPTPSTPAVEPTADPAADTAGAQGAGAGDDSSTAGDLGPERQAARDNLTGGAAPLSPEIADCVIAEITDEQLQAVDNFSDAWRESVAAEDEPSPATAAAMAVVQQCTGGVEATDS